MAVLTASGAIERAEAAEPAFAEATADRPMKFGVDSDGVALAKARGLTVSYGTFWLGAWTQKYGWASAETHLKAAAAANVTPVIQWWYWGDDISPSCVENGCTDRYHNVLKTKATWYQMSEELAARIARTIGTREAIVIIETEFNKNGIETYEPFDGYLADHSAIFKRRGNIKTVAGFGNWGKSQWTRFDRAVAAADYLGVQQLRSSIRDAAIYPQAITALVDGAKYLKTTFGKPTLVTDLGWSSYPSTSYESSQELLAEELFKRMGELKDAGVRGILYRMLVDDPDFDTANYHGMAERYWGLLRADKTAKPAFARFFDGIRAENTPAAPAPTPTPTPPVSRSPQNARAMVAGSSVRFEWSAPSDVTGVSGYLLEAGSAPGAADFGTVATASTSFSVPAVPNGVYYVRVRSIVNGVATDASNEVTAVVGGARSNTCGAAPAAPALSASIRGGVVTLTWNAGAAIGSYRLDAGSAPGLANIPTTTLPAALTTLAAAAAPGTYYIRLTAINGCGTSPVSNEVTVTVR